MSNYHIGAVVWPGRARNEQGSSEQLTQPTAVRHGESIATFTLVIVMAAAFGPYTPIAGVRTEQVAVYGCLLLALTVAWTRIRLTRDSGLFLSVWAIYVAVALIGVLIPVPAPYDPGKLLGGADNLLRPVAVFLLVNLLLVTTVVRQRLLSLACKIVTGAMCVNAILAFIESRVDIAQWLSLFWSSPTNDLLSGTVAGRSAQLGRFTGIVNQPAEAGTLYAIALLAALYVWYRRPWRLAAVLVLLTVGGVFTVSKIFLFVGVPIAVWQLLMRGEGRGARLAIAALAVFAAYGVLVAGLLPDWAGSQFLLRLANPTGDYLSYYSAGRFGPDSTLAPVVSLVISASPLTGFGLGGLLVPYDNGWIQALVFAGIIGVAAYSAVLLILVRASWTRRRRLAPAEAGLAGGLVVLAIGASAGFPALTGNRVATVLWVLLSLTLLTTGRSDVLDAKGEPSDIHQQPTPGYQRG